MRKKLSINTAAFWITETFIHAVSVVVGSRVC